LADIVYYNYGKVKLQTDALVNINTNLNKNKFDDDNYIGKKEGFDIEEKNFNLKKNIDTFMNLESNTYKSLKKDFLKFLVKE